ncbi:hypothetical protein EG329_006278 [Mollisiaceae sp. DMI_Dod_QoI]|nr:hypothetical protein EG329_006278 [Helotiales sp. DMI_Dod_QoI]
MKRTVLNIGEKTESTSASRSPNTLDPDVQSYFFIRRKTHDSPTVSPGFQTFKDDATKSPTAKSQKSQKTQKSGDSNKSKVISPHGNSIGSGLSASSQYRRIAEWNEKSIGASTGDLSLTPSSFESQRHPADPPRPAKSGLEWVWFPDGYWAEREVHDNPIKKRLPRQKWWSRSPEKPKEGSNASRTSDNISPKPDIPKIKVSSIFSCRSRSGSAAGKTSRKSSKGESVLSDKLKDSNVSKTETNITSPQQPEKLGLYYRTKKQIRKRLMTPKTSKMSKVESGFYSVEGMHSWASRTTTILEGASTYFAQREGGVLFNSSPVPPSPTSPDPRSRRVFGLAPWHQKNSNESLLSVSSSVHQLLVGKTPAATPVQERRYTASDGNTYPSGIEISSSDPHEPTFLPSEAQRINTPPMSPGTPTCGARGLFFDLSAANDSNSRAGSPTTSASSRSVTGRPRNPPLEWWEADSKHTMQGNKSSHQEKHQTRIFTPSAFELNLPPEHLPSSPLCPKNPMHPSGGTGICPFHGRRKSVGLKVIERASTGNTFGSGTTGTPGNT